MNRQIATLLLSVIVAISTPARALDIELVSGDWQPINIFIELFIGEEQLSGQPPSEIIAKDLTASGNFRVSKELQNSAFNMSEQRLSDVRERGGEYLLTGQVTDDGSAYTLVFTLYDTLTGDTIGSYSVPFSNSNKRLAAHNISNWIYEEVIGKAGIFHTKIAYIVRYEDGKNELKVADYDGFNQLTILSSDDIVISPTWTPDGNSLLYVSFEQNKPIVYQQSLLTGNRQIVANFKGSNSAPAMAPDNRTIAVALTEHGGLQQIYLLNDTSKSRLRSTDGINTEPTFSPDGKYIAFTSDEQYSPQIYEYNLDTNETRRLTKSGRYNVSPSYSALGDFLTFISRDETGDNVALLDVRSGEITTLTNIGLADSPSLSPNDDIIAFIDESNKKHLVTISINGKVTVYWELLTEKGKILDPVWSPMKSDWF